MLPATTLALIPSAPHPTSRTLGGAGARFHSGFVAAPRFVGLPLSSAPRAAVRGRGLAGGMRMGLGTALAHALWWKPAFWAYKFQHFMVASIWSQLLAVTLISLALISVGAVLFKFIAPDGHVKDFTHWMTRSYVMLNKVPSNNPMIAESHRERLVNNILFNLNTLTISVITGLVAATSKTAFDRAVNGNYQVLEKGHTVLLMDKWCGQVSPIIQHFDKLATKGDRLDILGHPVVVLSNLPKAKATEIIEEGRSTRGRKVNVLVRQGDPSKAPDLKKVSADKANRVVLLTADHDREHITDGTPSKSLKHKIRTDTALLKSTRKEWVQETRSELTGLIAVPGEGKHWTQYEGDFTVCEDQEFVGRLIAMCTVERSNGLSQVYNAVLQPGDANFLETEKVDHESRLYFLEGKKFDELQGHFPKSIICGIIRKSEVILAPKGDVEVEAGDSLLAFGRDKKQLCSRMSTKFAGLPPTAPGKFHETAEEQQQGQREKADAKDKGFRMRPKRHVIVLGWNERGEKTLREIAEVLPKGSKITTLQDKKVAVDPETASYCESKNVGLQHMEGDTMDRDKLEEIGAAKSDCIVCLFDSSAASNTEDTTDSELITTIQALGQMNFQKVVKRPRLVSMVHSRQTLKLIKGATEEAGLVADFILANELESGALVQVLMDPDLEKVFNEVLSPNSKELLSLQSGKVLDQDYPGFSADYLYTDKRLKVSFQQIQTCARRNGQIAIGLILDNPMGEDKVVLIPEMQTEFELGAQDRVVVIGDFKDAYA
uniref:RCK C-terminal domain-containing protein n=2 Tax=Hemiselmis andersenii TaxID=464988 RepID=A0A7S1EJ47_HEMAN|mmetsp:Transcript_50283/g.121998  ORF Transcript_50283/g.121998 Transcript_50283/m.121998 type:complete len:773 (+) Transcript_50283:195-2513(+)